MHRLSFVHSFSCISFLLHQQCMRFWSEVKPSFIALILETLLHISKEDELCLRWLHMYIDWRWIVLEVRLAGCYSLHMCCRVLLSAGASSSSSPPGLAREGSRHNVEPRDSAWHTVSTRVGGKVPIKWCRPRGSRAGLCIDSGCMVLGVSCTGAQLRVIQ